jgi:ankyrin repeat protein
MRHIFEHVHAQMGFTALMMAAEDGHIDCVRLLLDAGADKNAEENVRGTIV